MNAGQLAPKTTRHQFETTRPQIKLGLLPQSRQRAPNKK